MLGIMHYDRDGAPAFVFDMMEPERPKVDTAVLGFLKSEALHPADFTIREDGVVRLNPELARRVAAQRSAVWLCRVAPLAMPEWGMRPTLPRPPLRARAFRGGRAPPTGLLGWSIRAVGGRTDGASRGGTGRQRPPPSSWVRRRQRQIGTRSVGWTGLWFESSFPAGNANSSAPTLTTPTVTPKPEYARSAYIRAVEGSGVGGRLAVCPT